MDNVDNFWVLLPVFHYPHFPNLIPALSFLVFSDSQLVNPLFHISTFCCKDNKFISFERLNPLKSCLNRLG